MALMDLLRGALVACCVVAGVFFFRFWRTSGDRLFLFFAAGFWVFALNWLGLSLLRGPPESQHLIYLLRLLAFGLILVGIYDKNRREKRAAAERPSRLPGPAPGDLAESSRRGA